MGAARHTLTLFGQHIQALKQLRKRNAPHETVCIRAEAGAAECRSVLTGKRLNAWEDSTSDIERCSAVEVVLGVVVHVGEEPVRVKVA